MVLPYRIGVRLPGGEWYWEQVQAEIERCAQEGDITLVSLRDIEVGLATLPGEELVDWLERQSRPAFDVLFCSHVMSEAWYRVLERGLPVIALTETGLRHPRLIAPEGFYELAYRLGSQVRTQLKGQGNVLLVGGLLDAGEAGRSRLAGLQQAFLSAPAIHVQHIPSLWGYGQAYAQIYPALLRINTPLDAIIGLSDLLALTARDAAKTLGLLHEGTVIAGFGGEEQALVEIAQGAMTMTMDLHIREFVRQAMTLAQQVMRQGTETSAKISYEGELITATNVGGRGKSIRKAVEVKCEGQECVHATLHERQRLSLLELHTVINYLNGAMLERRQLLYGIAGLVRTNYAFEHVQILRWEESEQVLVLEPLRQEQGAEIRIALEDANVLVLALEHRGVVFIADAQHHDRFPADPRWPQTRTRVIIPIFQYPQSGAMNDVSSASASAYLAYQKDGSRSSDFAPGDTILGLLDLHCNHVCTYIAREFGDLAAIAELLGASMRGAALYQEALQARAAALEAQARAERVDTLKTRLLANVSHELRTPLHAILHYLRGTISSPALAGETSDLRTIRTDLGMAVQNAEHLMRLMNDLLDLARAEIDELTIIPQALVPRPFLEEVFQTLAGSDERDGQVRWKMDLLVALPTIEADPVRLRQILFNILDNARKFTQAGQIVLGAEEAGPYLHIWVQDSGCGIAPEEQERIFEPFVTGVQARRRAEGVGLGLSIVRRLIALHHGLLTLESQVEQGSTFHLYLPLAHARDEGGTDIGSMLPALLVISAQETQPAALLELCRQRRLTLRYLRFDDDLEQVWRIARPRVIVLDTTHTGSREWLLAERLRRHPYYSQLPLILYNQEQSVESVAGMTSILMKPVDQPMLMQMMEVIRPPVPSGSILIVDDDVQTCELYCRLARQAFPGYALHVAHNGAEALELLERVVPTMVILDLTMPDTDGFAVLDYLRVQPQTNKVPVLVMSGRTLSFEDVQRLRQSEVVFQSKDLLSPNEVASLFQHTLAGPRLATETSILIKQFIAYLQHHYAYDLSLQEIANALGVSERHLDRVVRQELNLSPWEYLNRYRVKRAQVLLRESALAVRMVGRQVGFNSSSYFGRVFRQYTGCSPSEYREQSGSPEKKGE